MDQKIFLEIKNGNEKGTIVFIHGNSSSSKVFEEVINQQKLPNTLISFDLPGHGRSYRSDNEDAYSIEHYKQTTLEVLKDHQDILLVGNSLGGHLALEVANEVNSLKGLVIFGAAPLKKPLNPSEAFLPNPVLQYYFSENVTDEQLDEAMNEAVQVSSVVPVLREDFRSCDPKVRSAFGKEIISGDGFSDEAAIFRKLSCPRYIFQGQQEPSVNLDYLKELCDASEGSAEIIMVDNCGHYAALEHPDFFADKLSDIASQIFERNGHA